MLVRSSFGTLDDGSDVTAYTLGADARGVQLTVLDLGATIARVRMPLHDSDFVDVALGLASASEYAAPTNPYLGSTVGRYANRIGDATFILDGVRHDLAPNEGTTCLHGGPGGFHSRQWSLVAADDTSFELQLVSADGDQGFPGEVTARVRYSVTADSVTIEHVAQTSAPTVVSLTNHAYLNLAGTGTIDEHRLTVSADAYLPVDERAVPLGRVEPVADTPFDLRHGATLGERAGADHPQVRQAGGLDHAFVLAGDGLRPVARLEHPPTGRSLEVSTTQPSLQVYTGHKLDGTVTDRDGRVLEPRAGLALECQAYPDAPNQPAFPSAVLRPGEEYHATTVWRFSEG